MQGCGLRRRGGDAAATDFRSGTLNFLDFNDVAQSCLLINDTTHNTDDPAHPGVILAWGGDPSTECANVEYTLTVAWKDNAGVTRTFKEDTFAPGNLIMDGAKSQVQTSVSARYFACDPDFSTTCNQTVFAFPK